MGRSRARAYGGPAARRRAVPPPGLATLRGAAYRGTPDQSQHADATTEVVAAGT